jgi:predicted ABC-type sugar transport system permease subunit
MKTKTNKKVFRSRISVLLIFTVLLILILVSFNDAHKSYAELCILAGTFLFFILILVGMRYIISGNNLYLRIWFIPSGEMNIANIATVERSYNPLSSPAASLKRLRIRFVNGLFWLISPVREQEFIEALKAVNPNIDVKLPVRKKGIWRIWDWDI